MQRLIIVFNKKAFKSDTFYSLLNKTFFISNDVYEFIKDALIFEDIDEQEEFSDTYPNEFIYSVCEDADLVNLLNKDEDFISNIREYLFSVVTINTL